MPLNEYECESCGHRFERIQKFSDPPVDTCPVCGKHVRKLLSSPAIQFKGTGWYVTDYAKKSSDSGSGKSSSSASSSSSSSGDKSDAGAAPAAPAASSSDSKPKSDS
jgi:putative FmdB family regulatory protein